MLRTAYLLAQIGVDTAESERHFSELIRAHAAASRADARGAMLSAAEALDRPLHLH